MRTRAFVFVALVVTIVTAAWTSSAVAGRLRIVEPDIRATFASLRFTNETPGGGVDALCPVTLEGSFHSATIRKVVGSLIGLITKAVLYRSGCTLSGITHITLLNGTERFLSGFASRTTLPWHIQYDSFSGTLPRITAMRVRIMRFGFLVLMLGNSCLYESTAASPAKFDFKVEGGGVVEELNAVNTFPLPVEMNPLFCASEMFLEGEAEVRRLNSMATIHISLI